GRNNLVRVAVTGLEAPAARARVTDRRGTLVGTAGLLPTGVSLAGELWVPLSRALGAEFQIDVEVGKQRVGRRLVRLVPPRRWTLYWIASSHTDVGLTGLQEESLEVHRRNLDAALARLPAHTDFCWTAECALQVISFVENRTPRAGEAPGGAGSRGAGGAGGAGRVTGPRTLSCIGGRGRMGVACCTGAPTSTPMARASGSTWMPPRWADASPTGCSPIPCSCPQVIP